MVEVMVFYDDNDDEDEGKRRIREFFKYDT